MKRIEKPFPDIQDVTTLKELKEQLKQDVMKPTLKWQERMNLYRTIQGINQQIDEMNA